MSPSTSSPAASARRLAIARARYFGGSLLLLDEPTSALSVKETEKVSEAVQTARKSGLGVVIIDHNIGHVHRICDRIVVMEGGTCDPFGSPRGHYRRSRLPTWWRVAMPCESTMTPAAGTR